MSPLRKIVGAKYGLVRMPLGVFDAAVLSRLPEQSPVRAGFQRGLSTLDATVGRFAGGGRSAPAPSDVTPADVPESPADTPEGSETPIAEPAEDGTEQLPQEDFDAVADAILEQEETVAVGEIADAPADDKEAIADLRAKHILEEREQQRRAAEERNG